MKCKLFLIYILTSAFVNANETKDINLNKTNLTLKALTNVKGISMGTIFIITSAHGISHLKDFFEREYNLFNSRNAHNLNKKISFKLLGSGIVSLYIAYRSLIKFRKSWRQFFIDNINK